MLKFRRCEWEKVQQWFSQPLRERGGSFTAVGLGTREAYSWYQRNVSRSTEAGAPLDRLYQSLCPTSTAGTIGPYLAKMAGAP